MVPSACAELSEWHLDRLLELEYYYSVLSTLVQVLYVWRGRTLNVYRRGRKLFYKTDADPRASLLTVKHETRKHEILKTEMKFPRKFFAAVTNR